MSTDRDSESKWDWEIKATSNWWDIGFQEAWTYRHLLLGLVKRDFLLGYQQTVLGPLWTLLQPIMTMLTYVVVFGKVVGINTGHTPAVLFYLAGVILWTLFNDVFTGTSASVRNNINLFGKVYFPRFIVPAAHVVSCLISFGIQFVFLLLILIYYQLFTAWHAPSGNMWLLAVPAVALVGAQSLAWGMLFSVLTGKYRDMTFVVNLGVRLLMFLTPVIYPVQYIAQKWRWVVMLNPLTSAFELFRRALLGEGFVTTWQLLCNGSLTLALTVVALLIFNKQVSRLIDVV